MSAFLLPIFVTFFALGGCSDEETNEVDIDSTDETTQTDDEETSDDDDSTATDEGNVTTTNANDDAGYDSSITFSAEADDYVGEVSSASGTEEDYEYIDLGLSSGLKWARVNIGASSPEERGYYYAWGEIETKEKYSNSTSTTYGVELYDISGNPQYDAAAALWGGHWRMPNTEEFQELVDECEWTWVKYNDVTGYVVTGSNGNSMFLPTTGYIYSSTLYYESSKGFYWSSMADVDNTEMAYDLYFYSTNYDNSAFDNYRRNGRPIRAIYDEDFEYEDCSAAIKLLAGNSSKKWKWDTSWRNDGGSWGNAGYDNGGTNGAWSGGIWWACAPADLTEQLNQSDTGVATGEEDPDAYMIFTIGGTLKSYDSNGNVIRSGGYSVSGYDGTYNQASKNGTANWALGTLSTTEGTILWPFEVNSGGNTVGDFEIMVLNDEELQLIYADEGTGSWSECTWWAFSSKNTGTINGYDYVDLGLPSGVKWATMNVGATMPADYGYYIAWGETSAKSSYTMSSSTTYKVEMGDISGNATYDIARAKWGSTWRIPTYDECNELFDECVWTETTQEDSDGDEINGYLIEGPNGQSIFMPSAGYKMNSSAYYQGSTWNYWTSTPNDDPDLNYWFAYCLFDSGMGGSNRYLGRSVRPVSDQ